MAQKTKKSQRTKLIHKKHTGHVRPHRHTSYGSLLLILLMACAPLLVAGHSAAADSDYGNYAVVAAPVPTTAPVITSPPQNKTFTTPDPITVAGQCPANTLIEVFKNEVMGGATFCKGGSFSLPIDLFAGTNSLIARAYNSNDQAGPDSSPVTVRSLPPGVNLQGTNQLNALGAPANQFYVTAAVFYRGSEAGDTSSWSLTLSGGQEPYAVSIGWGDGKTDLISRSAAGQFTVSHTYAKPAGNSGSYKIVIRASDQAAEQSYVQLVAIVSGNSKPTGVAGVVGGGYNTSTAIQIGWRLLALAAVVVFSFWVGERREARVLGRRPSRAV